MLDTTNGKGTGLGGTLRAHPVAIAVIGVECGWLAISATGAGERLRKSASDTGAQAIAWTQQLRDKLNGRLSRSRTPDPAEAAGYAHAREKSGRAMARARGDTPPARAVRHATAEHRGNDDAQGAHSLNERLSDARERFGGVVERHPLMFLGLTLAAGAAISLTLDKKQDGHGRLKEPEPLK